MEIIDQATQLLELFQNNSIPFTLKYFMALFSPTQWLVGAVGIYLLLYLFLPSRRSSRLNKSQHRQNIRASKKALRRIKKLESKGDIISIFNMLRSHISPYVFEELVLTSFSQYGARVIRSKRYSGDGGVDGEIIYKGEKILIQSKKYTHYIKAADTKRHISICSMKKSRGLFIHSGKSGKMSIDAVANSSVKIISGDDLIKLFSGKLNLKFFL
jgi:restriction system protein